MGARELAKAIRRELARRNRYEREHGSVVGEKVKAVADDVRSLIEEIRADLPEIGHTEEGPRLKLSDRNTEYLVVDCRATEVVVWEWKREATHEMFTFQLELNEDEEWIWRDPKHRQESRGGFITP